MCDGGVKKRILSLLLDALRNLEAFRVFVTTFWASD